MTQKPRITKNMILEQAFMIVKEQGVSQKEKAILLKFVEAQLRVM